jgi:hypothetical protein
MNTDDTDYSRTLNVIRSAIAGGLVGLLTYVASAIGVTALMPRRMEGSRQVVAVAWPFYASAPLVISCIVLVMLLFLPKFYRGPRIVMLIGAGLTIGTGALIGLDLMRRIFEGKF